MRRQQLILALLCTAGLGLLGCSNRTTANGNNDGGANGDGPYLIDDAGNIVRDDAGHPIPVQQDAGQAPGDGPMAQHDATQAQQDTGATPGIIQCGQTTCDANNQECCVTQGGASCIAQGTQCQGLPLACDGPEDCPTDSPVCCASLSGGNRGVTCQTDASCRGERLCRLDTDCAQGDKCCGSTTIGGLAVSWCQPEAQCPNTNPTTGVTCGNTSCDSPNVCCVTMQGSTCTASCQQGLSLACDGPEDCSGGTPVCCAQISTGGGGTTCVASGSCTGGGMGSGVVCHSNTDCATGTCQSLPMVNVRVCR